MQSMFENRGTNITGRKIRKKIRKKEGKKSQKKLITANFKITKEDKDNSHLMFS